MLYKFLQDNTDIQYLYDTSPFYELVVEWAASEDYTILVGRNMCRYKFDVGIFLEYIECIRNKNCLYFDDIKRLLDFDKYKHYPYGIDEFFLNYVLLEYMKSNNIIYAVYISDMLLQHHFII